MPTPINNNVPNNVVDLELPIEKRAFRFGKDDSRIVWINTADFGFMERLPEAYKKLEDLQSRVRTVSEGISTDVEETDDVMNNMSTMGVRLKALDTEMREVLDALFNAPVSAAAAPDGSMYDLYEGNPRYELIITVLIEQFGKRYTDEFAKVRENVKKRTDKYKGLK